MAKQKTKTAPKLRIWWIPQIPMKSFYASVNTVEEGALLLETLAQYDKFQYEHNIKPDYSNAGGLQVETEDGWEDWYSEDGEDIDEYMAKHSPEL